MKLLCNAHVSVLTSRTLMLTRKRHCPAGEWAGLGLNESSKLPVVTEEQLIQLHHLVQILPKKGKYWE